VLSRRGRVLVVEDEDTIGAILAEALAEEGFEVRWARNGREALAVLQSWLPHLILLDLMMPVMDGEAFHAAQQRLSGAIAKVPIIILSAARERAARVAAIGAVASLNKPFDLAQVIETVGRCMQTARSSAT